MTIIITTIPARVSEHRNRGFPESLLASTFSIAAWGNGVVAILAGILAQVAAGALASYEYQYVNIRRCSDAGGDIGPFQLAIFLTFITLFLIVPWKENYGSSDNSGGYC